MLSEKTEGEKRRLYVSFYFIHIFLIFSVNMKKGRQVEESH